MKEKIYLIGIAMLLIPVASAQQLFFAGSTYQFDFPNCVSLNATLICDSRIDPGEFIIGPNCTMLNESSNYTHLYTCKCNDGYKLNLTINPASKNKCTMIFTYLQKIVIPETTHTYTYEKEKEKTNTVYIPKVINRTKVIEKRIEVPIYIENATKIEELTKKINELEKSLLLTKEEKEKLKKALEGNMTIIQDLEKKVKERENYIYAMLIVMVILVVLFIYIIRPRKEEKLDEINI